MTRHYHDITLASFRRRQERSGEAAAIFYEKHPELGDFLAVPQAILYRNGGFVAGSLLPLWAGLAQRWELPGGRRALDRVLRRDYLRGLNRALSRRCADGGIPTRVTA